MAGSRHRSLRTDEAIDETDEEEDDGGGGGDDLLLAEEHMMTDDLFDFLSIRILLDLLLLSSIPTKNDPISFLFKLQINRTE